MLANIPPPAAVGQAASGAGDVPQSGANVNSSQHVGVRSRAEQHTDNCHFTNETIGEHLSEPLVDPLLE